MGGASIVNIALQIVRGKCVAMILGPAGVGLIGTFTSITALISAVAGMGINSSGVRQIAEATGSGDQERIARTAIALRRVSLVLGLLGAAVMVAMSPWLSQWTFGDRSHVLALMLLSLTVLFGAISGGQTALIQGTRRIGDLMKLTMLGAAAGTVASIPLVWLWGERGIAPFMIVVAACAIVTSWWYARKVPLAPVTCDVRQTVRECKPLLAFGFSLMVSGLLTLGGAYLIRVIVIRTLGMEATGHYQAAISLSSIYVGFVLSAMGTDFYPRLTAVSVDHAAMTTMVSEQSEISLLLAVPGILATLAFAPLVIALFYSRDFTPAVEVLRWQILGIALRVVSWPIGFAILAKGAGRTFIATEAAAYLVQIGGIWLFVSAFGLKGTGIAFFAMYFFYWAMVYLVVHRMIGFRYSVAARRILWWTLPAVAAAFLATEFIPGWLALIVTLPVMLAATWYCGNALAALVPESMPAVLWEKVAKWVR